MRSLSGGEILVHSLAAQGVRHVFSISGGQMSEAYDAIGRRRDMEVITPRCETAAPLLACGYIAAGGRPAVTMSTVGAGVVYEVGGLVQAWLRFVPLVSVAPQVQSHKMKPHQASLQGCDQDELFAPVTKFCAIVYHARRIPQLVNRAFREAHGGAAGPAHLDIPLDVMLGRRFISQGALDRLLPPVERTRHDGILAGEKHLLARAAAELSAARRPLVVLGQGLGRACRHPDVGRLLEELGVPVVTTLLCTGATACRSEVFCGDLEALAQDAEGERALTEADWVLVLGADPYAITVLSGTWARSSAARSVVQVESEARLLVGMPWRALAVQADPPGFLRHLIAHAGKRRDDEWKQRCRQIGEKLAEQAVGVAGTDAARELAAALSPEDIVVADGAVSRTLGGYLARTAAWAQLHVMDERQGAGAGLPFACGAALGDPGRRTVLVCDREALLHHVRELQPAVSAGLDLAIVCLDPANAAHDRVDTAAVLEGLGVSLLAGGLSALSVAAGGVRAVLLPL